ncbi:Flp1 family type IVb pilin [Ruminococcus sp.]|uniref:Flp1 family type IVb pilin n=1 Tax=Ruminococcus sp. TaxID=41978 RepID=UPI0025DCDC9B|nr:Flp1 family type IVb pilin [Ruminococcus sp.]MBR1432583.1 hypothetical protein [Ruminococcus sp.]
MKKMAFRCWVKSQMAKQKLHKKAEDLLSEECGGADSIVIAVIIIIIVIALAVIFREQIIAFVQSLFGKATEDAEAGGFM